MQFMASDGHTFVETVIHDEIVESPNTMARLTQDDIGNNMHTDVRKISTGFFVNTK